MPDSRVPSGILEHALVRDGTAELHATALSALLETADKRDVSAFAQKYSGRIAWLKSFLSHVDEEGSLFPDWFRSSENARGQIYAAF